MKITVLMGGTSSERDVSLASGVRIAAALRQRGHQVTSFDTARGILDEPEETSLLHAGVSTAPPEIESLEAMSRSSLSPMLGTMPAIREADVVFLALHGGAGEDGTVQALFDLCGVRYTASGPLASALAMDKELSKKLFRAEGVMTPDWLMAPRPAWRARGGRAGTARGTADTAQQESEVPAQQRFAEEVVDKLGLPVIVKPSKQGSTVGLTLVKSAEGLTGAIDEAFRYDDEVLVEQFVAGRELTVGILGDEALPVGEIFPAHELYDYECKYTKGMAVEQFPARLSAEAAARGQDQARRAFRALKLRGYARIDFRLSGDGGFFCLEANTLPGMTELSLLPQAAAAAGISFPELCERIVRLALNEGGDP